MKTNKFEYDKPNRRKTVKEKSQETHIDKEHRHLSTQKCHTKKKPKQENKP